MSTLLALKVDVDTDRGTRLGAPALAGLLKDLGIPACFLFSLGPDNTGKAIRRVFRPGFFQKVSRTNVAGMYGVRTLLNGTLLPAPHIGRRNAGIIRAIGGMGFETGIHCHDHFQWQDHLFDMSLERIECEFSKARGEYRHIFGRDARTAGAPGWQASAASREVYDRANLLYASDTRGDSAHFPEIGGRVFQTLEIPTTLPTFDELLGRPEFPDRAIIAHYTSLPRAGALNVMTIHAEIEGMSKLPLFRELLAAWRNAGVEFARLDELAEGLLSRRGEIPTRRLEMRPIDGRSGLVATQGAG